MADSPAPAAASIATVGNAMTVTNSLSAILNWQSFNIGANAAVKFVASTLNISNEGIITSPQGEVVLAAGNSATLMDTGTPELFLLSALSELKLFDKMKQPLEEMLSRQPANADIKALHDAYSEQMTRSNSQK